MRFSLAFSAPNALREFLRIVWSCAFSGVSCLEFQDSILSRIDNFYVECNEMSHGIFMYSGWLWSELLILDVFVFRNVVGIIHVLWRLFVVGMCCLLSRFEDTNNTSQAVGTALGTM